ncbi:hypothetical protein GGS21DRAFT_491713 [Xylaria nigripes]|nr:hypothetical protein GGS21DRAFT_491713 [Xylaria nigripes]
MALFVSGVSVGFWCEETERNIHWCMTVSLAILSILIMIAPYFQGREWRTFRLLVFVVAGFSGLAPIIHGIHMFGFVQMAKHLGSQSVSNPRLLIYLDHHIRYLTL